MAKWMGLSCDVPSGLRTWCGRVPGHNERDICGGSVDRAHIPFGALRSTPSAAPSFLLMPFDLHLLGRPYRSVDTTQQHRPG